MQGLLFDGAVKQPMYGKDDEVPVPRNNSSTSGGRPSADGIGDAELIDVEGKGTVDYIKMHSVSVHKIGNASEFPGPELGPTQNCLPVHNTKCMLLCWTLCIMSTP